MNHRSQSQKHENMSLVSRLLVFLACAQAVCAQPTGELLTNALDVLSLPADRALSGMEVSLQGVVTVAQPDWGGRFFVQDATAGIFVENISDRHPVPGDLIRVTGVSHPGGFAPIITHAALGETGHRAVAHGETRVHRAIDGGARRQPARRDLRHCAQRASG